MNERPTSEASPNARPGKLLWKLITLTMPDPGTGHHAPPGPSWGPWVSKRTSPTPPGTQPAASKVAQFHTMRSFSSSLEQRVRSPSATSRLSSADDHLGSPPQHPLLALPLTPGGQQGAGGPVLLLPSRGEGARAVHLLPRAARAHLHDPSSDEQGKARSPRHFQVLPLLHREGWASKQRFCRGLVTWRAFVTRPHQRLSKERQCAIKGGGWGCKNTDN